MNSYTLTSKKIKRNIFFTFILVIISFIFVDLCLYLYSDLKTTKTTFIEEKSSKIKHFNLNKEENRDYVFIGSSRTIYHVSTEMFRQNNLNIYNFGVSGNFLLDYPSFIKEAIKQKPKNIVISLPKEIFFSKDLDVPKYPLIEDLSFFYKIGEHKILLKSFFNWLENLHLFFSYSETIFLKISGFYNNFNVTSKNSENNVKQIINREDNQMKLDCNIFSILKSNDKQIIKCTNGDGILIGKQNISNVEIRENNEYILNNKVVNIINNFIYKIEITGINAIIIFEPSFDIKQLKEVKDLINTRFLDFSNLIIDKSFWIDNTHLNSLGRDFYSNTLVRELNNVNK